MDIRIMLNIALCFGYTSLVTGQATEISRQSHIFSLNMGHTEMSIDGNEGGMVISFKSNKTEILGLKELHKQFYGSTLWLGPQGKWKGHKVLDASPYALESYESNREVSLRSGNDSLNGFTVSKHFRLMPSDSSVSIEYTITNISKKVQEVAPWEVTRVPTGGLAFFPKAHSGDLPTGNQMYPILKVQDSVDIIWYPYDGSIVSPEKLFMNGSEGWTAYLRDGMLFIKKFPVIDPSQAAPGEKNVEIYVNKEKTYMELENQGIYEALAPGGSLTYQVNWYARRLSRDLKPEVGNMALVDYVRKVLGAKQ